MTTEDLMRHPADESGCSRETGRAGASSADERETLVRQIAILQDEKAGLVLEIAGHVVRIGDLELDVKRLQNDVDTLGVAVDSNRRIGAAVGILMSRLGIREEAAFLVLKEASQATNTKLHAVAALVVESGEAPSRKNGPGNSGR